MRARPRFSDGLGDSGMQTWSGLLRVLQTGAIGSSATPALVTLVFITGALTRLWGIGGSLWLDEFSTLWIVDGRLSDVASRVQSFQGQTPFYYCLTWGATHLLGESELALRLSSLLASFVTAAVCGWAAYAFAGSRAGVLSFSFAWLMFPSVQAAVSARPYALAMAGVALGVAGYVRAARDGTRTGRALLIVGVAIAFWAHFLLALPLVGLIAIHLAHASPHTRYRRRQALVDCAIALALCAPAWPWVAAALTRTQHVRWLAAPQHLDAVLLIIALLVPWLSGRSPDEGLGRAMERALLGGIVATIVCLELAQLAGAQLVTGRYLWPIIVPAAVVAGVRASSLRGSDLVVALGAFGLITAGTHVKTFLSAGSASGIGAEDWRSATTALRQRAAGVPLLVLYRSGFVEEDADPLGSASPATLAPMRSPGDARPAWHVLSLTYRWDNPRRETYFNSVVAPAVASRSEFALLCQRTVESGGSYTDRVVAWVDHAFPDMFTPESIGRARGVDVMLFRRSALARIRQDSGGPSSPYVCGRRAATTGFSPASER
jgi:Dolichyl-phosphate-mannose-protein mannosyltransferase